MQSEFGENERGWDQAQIERALLQRDMKGPAMERDKPGEHPRRPSEPRVR